jgi:putative FmdB family regulatory protein
MPTYEYACSKCGEHLEVYQSFTDPPLKRHQACGGQLQKVFSAVGIVLKGSGFYKTDSRAGARSKSESRSEAAETKSETTTETKTETTKSDSSKSGSAKSNGSSKSNGSGGAAKPAKPAKKSA